MDLHDLEEKYAPLRDIKMRDAFREQMLRTLRTERPRGKATRVPKWVGVGAGSAAAIAILASVAVTSMHQSSGHPEDGVTSGVGNAVDTGQFATPPAQKPDWLATLKTSDVVDIGGGIVQASGTPLDTVDNRLITRAVSGLQKTQGFAAPNVAYSGTAWQITLWLKNGRAIAITPVERSADNGYPVGTQQGPGPGAPSESPQHNQYQVILLKKPSSITDGGNWIARALVIDKAGNLAQLASDINRESAVIAQLDPSQLKQNHFFDGAITVWLDGKWSDAKTGQRDTRYVLSLRNQIVVYNLNNVANQGVVYESPKDIGDITITNILPGGTVVSFTTSGGKNGTLDLTTKQWVFE